MSKLPRRALLVGGALALAGCKRLRANRTGTKRVTCRSGEHCITVPAHWNEGALKHEQAEILQGSTLDATFVIVIAEPKEDFSEGLEGYADLVATGQSETLKGASFDPAEPREIHGMRALFRQVRGSTNGLNIVYLNALVEAPRHFAQVLAWTAKSRFATHRSTLMSVIDSFETLAPKAH